jgi:hypothetical protein
MEIASSSASRCVGVVLHVGGDRDLGDDLAGVPSNVYAFS